MADPKLGEVKNWLKKARQDLDAAAWLLESPKVLYGAVGFHSQQAAEKSLKAFLSWVEEPFDKTHSLPALVALCLEMDVDFEELRMAATTLTPYAVSTRYPGDIPDISHQEAQDALALAHQVWEFVQTRLPKQAQI
jgi:HEPN domain-containing protein